MTRDEALTLIDEQALHERAAQRGGHDDFGDSGYREGLGVLLAEARESSRLTAIASRLSSLVTDTLVSRLSSQAGWNSHPEVLDNPIPAPLVITGLPRSGTTLLHFLMSLDPQFQWTPRWVGEAPIIRPPRENWEDHSQYQLVHDRVEEFFRAHPGMRAAHEMGAGLADECITVMVQSFMSNMFVSMLPLRNYREWFFEANEIGSYHRYKNNLRLMGAMFPEKTWLLKNPWHTMGMKSLLDTFPDARVIVLHRNPIETVASGASLTFRNADFWEKKEIGPIRLEVCVRAVERMAEARSLYPDCCLDIRYRDLVRDPLNVIRTIYSHYALSLSHETEAIMTAWLEANPQGKHGKHRYSSDEFGITEQELRHVFSDYIDEYCLEG